MAAKTSTVVNPSASSDEMDRVVAALIASRGSKKPVTSISEWLTDKVADSGRGISRIGAGFAAATENAALSYEAERLRQTRRTAASILAAAKAS